MIPFLELPAPALHWTDGHVLGNGDVGAVVWGTADRLCIGFSKHDVNDLRGPQTHGARLKPTYPEIRDRVMAGERDIKGLIKTTPGGPRSGQQQIACGRLALELLRGVQPIGFSQSLSLERAEITVEARPTVAGWTFGMAYQPIVARTFVAAERNVVIVELSSDAVQHVRWTFDRSPDPERPQPVYRVSERDAPLLGLMQHGLPHEVRYAVTIGTADSARFDVSAARHGLMGTVTFGGDDGPAFLLVGLASTFDARGGDLAESAERLVSTVDARAAEAIGQRHVEWWHDFWTKSEIHYEDSNIEQLWYAGLYAMGASTRPHTSPPNLQGIWVQDEISPWHTDLHFNTNVQECHWGACGANHPELQEALVRVLTDDWRAELDRTGMDVYGVDAPALTVATDWLGRAISAWGFLELSVTPWTAQHVWEQFLYTRDDALLHDSVYPFLRDCAKLCLSFLVEDGNGQLNIELSHSPEQIWHDDDGQRYTAYGRNPTIDLSCFRTLLEAVLECAERLGESDAVLATCRDTLAHLPPLPTHDGVLIDYETGFFHDGDRPGRLPHCHRHPSRLMPIFPGRQIGLHSGPATLDLGRRSFREFRSFGEAGFTGWSYAYQACIAARLGLGHDAETCLHSLCEGHLLRGMLTSHNSITPGVSNYDQFEGGALFQIEALFGAVAAVNEMLVQRTADGVIRVFPAVPPGRTASFRDLRAPGAVLVSAAKSATDVEWVSVRSEQACQIALASPWAEAAPSTAHPELINAFDRSAIRWHATPGRDYRFVAGTG